MEKGVTAERELFYFFHPFPIQFRRNLGRLDFRTFTPENSRVEDGNAGSLQMAVNRRLVLQNGIFSNPCTTPMICAPPKTSPPVLQ